MSQEKVYDILKEMGGKATTIKVSKKAKSKFPDATLYLYVGQQLNKLERKKCVKKSIEGKNIVWEIIDEY